MEVIPVKNVASQTLKTQLAQQTCFIKIYQKSTGLYIDLRVDDRPVVTGVLCRDRVITVRHAYLGFTGDIVFIDTEGFDDPYYTGLGGRWFLAYLSPEEVTE